MQNIENKTEEHLNPTKFQDAPGTGVIASLIFYIGAAFQIYSLEK